MPKESQWINANERVPKAKKGWDHSERVLVHYDAIPNEKVEGYGIAYYHYKPPFKEQQCWIDFNDSRTPTHWMPIPELNKDSK
jgi:hypothetical protein